MKRKRMSIDHRACRPAALLKQGLACAGVILLAACGARVVDSPGDTAQSAGPKSAGPKSAGQGSERSASSSCVDPDRIDPSRMCTMDYTPVCGCDGKTYSNSCTAAAAGLTAWGAGGCVDLDE